MGIPLMILLSLLAIVMCNDECTKGFMDYERLSVKASHIADPNDVFFVTGIGSNKNGLTYVVPSLNFSCSGTITGFLLAVDIRIDNNRNQYPWIGLFNQVNSKTYSLVPNSTRDIILGPDDFSTSGLYNYTLSSPLQFTSGDIIGVYQPRTVDSVVRLQRQTYDTDIMYTIIRIDVNGKKKSSFNSTLLIFPLPAADHSACCLSSSFISYKDLMTNAKLVGAVSEYYGIFSENNIFFKDIKFTCNGSITNVIVGMKQQASTLAPSEIRLWSPFNHSYIHSGRSISLQYSDAVSDISTDYLRWYNLSVPVQVKEGDVLGIYHDQRLDQHESVITHQRFSGPYNYYSIDSSDEVYNYNIYPLVSVVVSPDIKIVPSSSLEQFSKLLSSTSQTVIIKCTSTWRDGSSIVSSSRSLSAFGSTSSLTQSSKLLSRTIAGHTQHGYSVSYSSAVASATTLDPQHSSNLQSQTVGNSSAVASTTTQHSSNLQSQTAGNAAIPSSISNAPMNSSIIDDLIAFLYSLMPTISLVVIIILGCLLVLSSSVNVGCVIYCLHKKKQANRKHSTQQNIEGLTDTTIAGIEWPQFRKVV